MMNPPQYKLLAHTHALSCTFYSTRRLVRYLSPSQSCSISAKLLKRANREQPSLIPIKKRTTLNTTSPFQHRLPNKGFCHSLKSTTHGQFDCKDRDTGIVFGWLKGKGRRGGWAGGSGGITIRYTQSQSVAFVNRLILLECHVQSSPVSAVGPAIQAGAGRVRATPGSSQWRDQSRDRGMGPISLCSRVSQNKRILLSDGSHMEVVLPRNRWCRGLPLGDTCTLLKGSAARNTSGCLVCGWWRFGNIIHHITTWNYTIYNVLWRDLLKTLLPA